MINAKKCFRDYLPGSLDASFPNQFFGANSCSPCEKHSGLGLICPTVVHILIAIFDPSLIVLPHFSTF